MNERHTYLPVYQAGKQSSSQQQRYLYLYGTYLGTY